MHLSLCRSTAFFVAFLSFGTSNGQCDRWELIQGWWLYGEEQDERALIVSDTLWTVIRRTYTGRAITAYSVTTSERDQEHPFLPICLLELTAGPDTIRCIVDDVSAERLYLSCSGIGGGYRRAVPSEVLDYFGSWDVLIDPAESVRQGVDTSGSKVFESFKGRYALPLANATIEEPTGKRLSRMHPNTNSRSVMRSDSSEPVRVIAEGQVSAVLNIPGGSKIVLVDHGAYRSVYIDLVSVQVKKGALVDRLQVIGMPMCASDSCWLAFELWRLDNEYPDKLDPRDWFLK